MLCFLVPGTAAAYDFSPTDSEWASWPGYCKAKYAWTQIGRRSRFAQTVTLADRQDLAKWENAGIPSAHHFCAGAIYLRRAMVEQDEVRRKFDLGRARDETQFTYADSDRHSPYFVFIVAQLANIMYEQDQVDGSITLLNRAIADQPSNGGLYSVLAIIQRKQGDLKAARETLLRGFEAVDGKSAELAYNLGLVSLELGNVDDASRFAATAYEMGYPLQGLRHKLERINKGEQ